jgi:hypothetical protein
MLLPYGIVTQMSKIINKEDGEYMELLFFSSGRAETEEKSSAFVKSHEHGQLC